MTSLAKRVLVLMGVLAVVVGALSPAAMGKGPPAGKGPGGGEETGGNNLSAPTIMIGSNPFGVSCVTGQEDLAYPTGGLPLDEPSYVVDGSYFVQGIHTWQSECDMAEADAVSADAAWGDNLSGDAKLKASKPIRVELGLTTGDFGAMFGFDVIKLEDTLDRLSAYGTLASTDDGGQTWYATATDTLPVRVFDPDVTFTVFYEDDGVFVEGLAPEDLSNPTAEINATGKVVYGYNLRVNETGDYTITFRIPNLLSIGTVLHGAAAQEAETGDWLVSISIEVVSGGGGGGGGPSH